MTMRIGEEICVEMGKKLHMTYLDTQYANTLVFRMLAPFPFLFSFSRLNADLLWLFLHERKLGSLFSPAGSSLKGDLALDSE